MELIFKRIQPGEYSSCPGNTRVEYLIDRRDDGWTAFAPTGPAGPRHVIGIFDTLKAAKIGAQAYQDHLDVLAETRAEPTPDPEMVAAGLRYLEEEKVLSESLAERRGDYTHDYLPAHGGAWCVRLVKSPKGDTVPCHEPVKSAIHDPQAFAAYHAELTEALAEWSGKDRAKVQLSPRRDSHSRDVTDIDLTQLLLMLDHGVTITRKLYQSWQIERTAALATAIDPVKLDATVRAVLAAGLADYTGSGTYTLNAAPIHLARTNDETFCGRRITHAGHDRIRYTYDRRATTHGRCKEQYES